MRNAALITGIIFLFITLLALMFKIMHWPGSGLGTVIGVSFFILAYLPLLLAVNLERKPKGLILVAYLLGTLSGWILFAGMLFVIQHWPTGHLMFNIGLVTGGLFLIFFILGLLKDPS